MYHKLEFSKLAQKEYKTWNDWMSKAIHKKLNKKLKLEKTIKLYLNKIESVQENDTHNIL